MVKNILFLLLIFAILVQGKTITQKYSIDVPQIRNGRVFVPGCHLRYEHFTPSVVEQPVVLLLPKGQEAISLKVEYDGMTVLDGAYELKPIQPGVRPGSQVPTGGFSEMRSSVYAMNQFFPPQKRSNWFNTQVKNGHTIVFSSVNPVQYNPITGEIRYYKIIKVQVETGPANKVSPYLCTPSIASELKSLVDNPEAVDDLTYTQQGEDAFEYLIITSDALKNEWADFIAFNERRCLRSKIETVVNISATGTGSDLQEKIRNYIKEQYANHQISYVMLGTDDNPSDQFDIPARLFRCKFWDHDQTNPSNLHDENDIAGDLYYETLDGTWKNAGDNDYGLPGSQDMTWDVYAGRFTADDATDIKNAVNKTIKYSESPVTNEIKRLFLCGNYAWHNPPADPVWGGNSMDEHAGTCTNNQFTTAGFPESDWQIGKLYDRDLDPDKWSVSDLRAKFKQDKPTFFIHEGHGNTTFAFNENATTVNTSNYPANGADKGNYFIIMTGACLPGNFNSSQDCIMEAFLNLSTGAVATIAPDKSGWGDNDGTDGSTHRIYRYLIDGLFNQDHQMHHLGRLVAQGREANADIVLNTDLNTPPYFYCITYCVYETNLFGDPALSVWTDTPGDLSPQIPDVTDLFFEWDTQHPYTWVALVNESDSIFATQLTGKDGKCKIEDDHVKKYIEDNAGNKLTVRAKAHNFLPYEGEVSIILTNIKNGANNNVVINNLNVSSHSVKISYTLKTREQVNISIYNSKGLLIKTLVEGSQKKGNHLVTFDTDTFSNGIYYCRITSGNLNSTQKFIITK